MKNVRAELTEEEYLHFIEAKGDKTTRELLLESVGLVPDTRKMGPKGKLQTMFKFGKKGKDDLVSEEAQGNTGQMTESKRARLFFSVSIEEWDLLSEVEKLDYIERMTAIKKRAGGGEMSERDALQLEHDAVADEVFNFFQDQMLKKTRKMEADSKKYSDDREK